MFAYIYAENNGLITFLVGETKDGLEKKALQYLSGLCPDFGSEHSQEWLLFKQALKDHNLNLAIETWNKYFQIHYKKDISCHQITEISITE